MHPYENVTVLGNSSCFCCSLRPYKQWKAPFTPQMLQWPFRETELILWFYKRTKSKESELENYPFSCQCLRLWLAAAGLWHAFLCIRTFSLSCTGIVPGHTGLRATTNVSELQAKLKETTCKSWKSTNVCGWQAHWWETYEGIRH